MRLFLSGRVAAVRAALAALLVLSAVTGTRVPALAVGGVTGTINGTVTDTTTKAPVADVTVTAASPSQTSRTHTNAKGFFAFVGLPLDTYTVSFEVKGYEVYTLSGITVQGDQQVSADASLVKSLRTIGRVASRSASAAYQPKQTTDSYQISGAQQQAALGRAGNVSQTQLQSSVPSITTTFYGSSSIRGSTRTEIAYQFDGVDYTDPLSSQFQNSLALNGTQALQVNPGAGDATQGNAGAGAVNIVVKRGARPTFGNVYLEATGYPYGHLASFEYGWATPNGRLSNYTSFVGSNSAYQFGPIGMPAVVNGMFLSQDYTYSRDFINNTVFKFGHDNSRSLQFLYQTRYNDFVFNHGGIDNLCYKTCDPNIAGQLASAGGINVSTMQSIIGLLPGQTSPTQKLYYQGFNHQPADVMKLEYAQQLDPTTYWTNRLFRVVGNAIFNRPYDTQTTSSRTNLAQGGVRTGLNGELIKQFGEQHQVTLGYSYQAAQSVYDWVSNTAAYRSLTSNVFGFSNELYDFIDPRVTGETCPVAKPSVAQAVGTVSGSGCGYLAQFYPNGIPRVPNFIDDSAGFQHLWGFGIRDQFNVNPKLRLDYGVRYDASDYQIVDDPGTLSNEAKHPRVVEPRFAFAYQFGRNDAVRFSYGRSVQFIPAGSINAPVRYTTQFANIPSRDPITGKQATYCVAPLFNSPCVNYAQQIHDEYLQFNGLEAFNVKPSTYGNYDFSYSHQFANNTSVKVTPFFKRGYGVALYSQPVIGTDPVSGLAILGASTLSNVGVDKTTGVEFLLTKDVPLGLSGFLALTYVNRLQNVPPNYGGQTEDFYPSIPPASAALGNLYRAGYLSPLNGRLGVQYKSRAGFRINPIVSYDRGYPIVGAGTLTNAFVNNKAVTIPNTNVSVPGFGIIANGGAPSTVTQYVSPTNPGSVFNPNIAATRGTPETSLAGGILSKARLSTDIDLEYSAPGSKNAIGLYISNLFGQIYSEPALNTRYQPVATGVAGPQTGQTSGYYAFGPALGYYNWGPERFGQSAYTLSPNLAPVRFRIYYQVQL